MLSIGILIFPEVTQLDLTGPFEVFARLPDTKVDLLAKTLEPVYSSPGHLKLTPTLSFEEAPQFDLIMVPGGSGVGPLMEDQETLNFLRAQAEGARYVTSVCTGALVLGAAGLLQGYKATTHWLSLDLLEPFGAIPVSARVVLDRNRVTGGGVTAGIDFGLTLAAELFDTATAKAIQLMMEYDPAPPFDSGSPTRAEAELVDRLLAEAKARQQRRKEIAHRAANALRA